MTSPVPENRTEVDFVINVFERTYRRLLQPGCIAAKVSEHCYHFRRVVVLVNNVDDRASVEAHLAQLIATQEINEAYFVADRLEEALRKAQLSRAELGTTIHYSDCSLVAIFLPGSPYLLYCDADVGLDKPHDWITPALQMFQQDPRIAVANPDWTPSTLHKEAREYTADFGLGYGFSDQLFLIARKEFARPIYQRWTLVSWRYPLSHIAPVFEQRVDAYMRLNFRLRATYNKVSYLHGGEEGATYPSMTFSARWKRRIIYALLRLGERVPGQNPFYHM